MKLTSVVFIFLKKRIIMSALSDRKLRSPGSEHNLGQSFSPTDKLTAQIPHTFMRPSNAKMFRK